VLRFLGIAALAVLLFTGCAQPRRCRDPLPFGPAQELAVGALPLDVAAADLNGDGAVDLVSADARTNALSVLLGRGDGAFSAAVSIPVGVAPHLVSLADVDRDEDPDAIASDHDSAGVAVLLGDGKGGFQPAVGSPFTALGGQPHNHGLAVGDVSGDSVPDVITANQVDKSVSILLGDGTGRLSSAPASPLALGAEPYLSRLADVDSDGKLDLVVPLARRFPPSRGPTRSRSGTSTATPALTSPLRTTTPTG
jgi:hypothetical protein